MSQELEQCWETVWRSLIRGKNDRRHAFRFPVVSSVDREGRPDARIVVLRQVQRERRQLVLHTDRRAAKVGQLDGGLAFTFYDRGSSLQVRAFGRARIADEVCTDAHWKGAAPSARKAYLVDPAPGTAFPEWTSGHDTELQGDVIPAAHETERGRDNFAVVITTLERLEALWVKRTGHLRCHWVWRDGWEGSWLVP